ncbi:hypothetical protein chiPu_0024253 [Chiloscyllium punctatum]|uniref:Uncharacterized protein n=1 Tax=Chiloscyllium punctatum TaxID=137246 RepID=A0A401TCJ2_CHIPU|nr:hypothetical protein [Chiloscyllium punctatum]
MLVLRSPFRTQSAEYEDYGSTSVSLGLDGLTRLSLTVTAEARLPGRGLEWGIARQSHLSRFAAQYTTGITHRGPELGYRAFLP